MNQKIALKEKIGYALGDGAANIAWRGVSTFLLIFYVDVFGLDPAAVGILMLICRSGDGISDVLMGVVGDRTKSKHGKFRPWVLWTAIPLALMLALLFTSPSLSDNGKLVYAYVTYILFTLIYTANNIPYGALMAVMTSDNRERTSIGSFRMAGAFSGGMIVQGALLYLVLFFGNVNPQIDVTSTSQKDTYEVTVSTSIDVETVSLKTESGIAQFTLKENINNSEIVPVNRISFAMEADKSYTFIVTKEADLTVDKINLIDQKAGYSYAIYVLSIFLAIFMIITFLSTKERVTPPATQESDLWADLKQLVVNKPWLVLLLIGLMFNIYNNIKQGITVIYFVHYIHDELLAASYLVGLALASIAGALAANPLSHKFGKKKLFIYALLFSGGVNSLLYFCDPSNITAIFTIGIVSEFAAAFFPTLFFTMLGDAADYSEWKNGRRATGLIYSAGSFATKFGGGIAGAIIGFVLSAYGYSGGDSQAIAGAIPGVIILMSWVPGVIAIVTAGFMFLYPLDQDKLDKISDDLHEKREKEKALEAGSQENTQADSTTSAKELGSV